MSRRTLAHLAAIALVTSAAVVGSGPTAGGGEAPPSVGYLSDSMGTFPREETIAALTVDRPLDFYRNLNASTVAVHLPFVGDHVNAQNSPDFLVVMLGTAEAQWDPPAATFEADVRTFLDSVTPHVSCLRWLDIPTRPAPFYAALHRNRFAFNDALRRAAADYPDVELVHYSAWTELADPTHFAADGLHTSPRGDLEVANMVRTAVNGCDPALTSGPFWDVADSFWAADEIAWLHDVGLATGYDNRTYRARVGSFEIPITRGQLASMLWRYAGSPGVADPHPFSDGAAWIDQALRWIWSDHLMTGYPDSTFRPNQPMSRAETTRLLWRAAGSPTGHPPHPFTDVAPWLDPAADWIAATAIATGWPDLTFRPDNHLTRAQIARILHRYDAAGAAPPAVSEPPPPTAPPPSTAPAPPAPTTSDPSTTTGP